MSQQLIASVKFKSLIYITSIKDTIIKKTMKPPHVKSIDETLDEIIDSRCSVSRYGSGEIKIIMGSGISFQTADPRLAARLKQILTSSGRNIIICLPDVFKSMDGLTDDAESYWRQHLFFNRYNWYKLTTRKKAYYNAFISRIYLDIKDKTKCAEWFNKWKRVWYGRDIVIVEGNKSRLGVDNDLFDDANSVVRILAPAENAFTQYNTILDCVRQQKKSKLILLALGPTATVLAYDLHKEGFQAIDIGHIDLEYEWFLRKTEKKMKIPYKYVNEVGGGSHVAEVDDEKYRGEIIRVID